MRHFLFSLLGWLMLTGPAQAILTIDITQGIEGALPIAIVPFAWQATSAPPADSVSEIVSNDLARSGRFAPLPTQSLPQQPTEIGQIDFNSWRTVDSRYLVIGGVQPAGGGYVVRFQLFDVLRGEQIIGYSLPVESSALRRTAHRISDLIYEALTGEPGAFDSRIAYITAQGRGKSAVYRLQIADTDGAGGKTIVTSKEPLLSPTWSPDGARLAYVSLEGKRSAIYVQDIASGQRSQVAAWPGLNGAPAWSPDGSRLALSLSKDGNSEIYLLNLGNRNLQRLTQNPAIDTEPSWAPDGQSLVFTSDRGGQPQIYRMGLGGGTPQRLTYSGSYNASASFSPDASKLVMLNGNGGAYRIAVLDLATNQTTVLTNTSMDESPSFAPNGSMVIYAVGRDLAAVSVDGRVRQRLAVEAGAEVREPAWSPRNR